MATAPGTEGPLEVEAGDTLIGADEGILDHILDQRLVMGNQIGSPERPERVDPHQDVHPVDLASSSCTPTSSPPTLRYLLSVCVSLLLPASIP